MAKYWTDLKRKPESRELGSQDRAGKLLSEKGQSWHLLFHIQRQINAVHMLLSALETG